MSVKSYEYVNAARLKEAVSLLPEDWDEVKLIAGGTDLIGEMKERLITPKRLINLKSISNLDRIEFDTQDGLKIGALAKLKSIAEHQVVKERFAALSQAASSVGSPQIRTVGTIGGNLCQRPRCWYYRGVEFDCLRKGGFQCFSVNGVNKYHAVIGDGPCYIVHPSSTAPALIALGATVKIAGAEEKEIPLEEFFVMPDVNFRRENILKPNEIVAEVQLPTPRPNTKSCYMEQGEGSADWALASAAAALTVEGGTCREARVVLGGVAPAPWRSKEAEQVLKAKKINEATVQKAADAALAKANPMSDNAYKVTLAKTLIKRAVLAAGQ